MNLKKFKLTLIELKFSIKIQKLIFYNFVTQPVFIVRNNLYSVKAKRYIILMTYYFLYLVFTIIINYVLNKIPIFAIFFICRGPATSLVIELQTKWMSLDHFQDARIIRHCYRSSSSAVFIILSKRNLYWNHSTPINQWKRQNEILFADVLILYFLTPQVTSNNKIQFVEDGLF